MYTPFYSRAASNVIHMTVENQRTEQKVQKVLAAAAAAG